MAIRRNNMVPVQCEDDDKISTPCQDNPFGFNCMVVFDDKSYPLRRCTPFMNWSGDYRIVVPEENHVVGEVLDSFTVNGDVSINTDDINQPISDGLPPGLVTAGGRRNSPERTDTDERCKKEMCMHQEGRKKKAKRRRRK